MTLTPREAYLVRRLLEMHNALMQEVNGQANSFVFREGLLAEFHSLHVRLTLNASMLPLPQPVPPSSSAPTTAPTHSPTLFHRPTPLRPTR
jgi:hypothetical protein